MSTNNADAPSVSPVDNDAERLAGARLYIRSDMRVWSSKPPTTQELIAWLEVALNALDSRDAALREAREETEKWKSEILRMDRQLHEGTLHVGYCNGNHDARVGAPDLICNCTLGREIKALRHGLREAREALLDCAQSDATMEGPAFKGWNRSSLDRLRAKYERALLPPSTPETKP